MAMHRETHKEELKEKVHKKVIKKPKKKAVKSKEKIAETMREFAKNDLHSGSKTGPLVKNKRQALAIGYSQKRKASKNKK